MGARSRPLKGTPNRTEEPGRSSTSSRAPTSRRRGDRRQAETAAVAWLAVAPPGTGGPRLPPRLAQPRQDLGHPIVERHGLHRHRLGRVALQQDLDETGIHKILTNDLYIGVTNFGVTRTGLQKQEPADPIKVADPHQGLVPREEFDQVQRLMSERAPEVTEAAVIDLLRRDVLSGRYLRELLDLVNAEADTALPLVANGEPNGKTSELVP